MRTRKTLLSLFAMFQLFGGLFTLLSARSIFAQQSVDWDSWDVVSGKLIVKYRPSKAEALKAQSPVSVVAGSDLTLTLLEKTVEDELKTQKPNAVYTSILPNTFIGEFDPAQRDNVLRMLAADPEVEYFEPVRLRKPKATWGTDTPNDPFFDLLWGMQRIGAPDAWRSQPAERSAVRVAVCECQYDDAHIDLQAQNSQAQNGRQCLDEDGQLIQLDFIHATHVAGTIAATGNNGLNVVGVANVELVSLRYPNDNVGFAQLIAWAVQNQVQVINMSWKWCGDDDVDNGDDCFKCLYPAPSQAEQEAITNALPNIVFVAAASNEGCNTDEQGDVPLPVGYTGVIGVSALNQDALRADFSNFGPYVDLTAPGVDILSTRPGNQVMSLQGTSMASPHVAGSAAAILAVSPRMARVDIRSITRLLQLTAEDIGPTGKDEDFGWGVVRVDRAVDGIADVYADNTFSIPFVPRLGTLFFPYRTVKDALDGIEKGGRIGLVGKSSFREDITSDKPFVIEKACTIISVGGAAIIGQ